jgi:antitoxin component YwqK of YwqJK toxin-antitoxin module
MKAISYMFSMMLFISCGNRENYLKEYDIFQIEIKDGKALFYKDKGAVTGIVTDRYGNGVVRTKSTFFGGFRHGLSEEWYSNGNLKSESTYNNGDEVELVEWYSDGKIKKKMEGRIKVSGLEEWVYEFDEWWPNGKLKHRIQRLESNIESELFFDESEWWENGSLKSISHYNINSWPAKVGEFEEWWENGKLKTLCTYSATNFYTIEKKDGICQEWWENGNPKYYGYFLDGREVGIHQSWWENGNKRMTYNNLNGFPIGYSYTFWYKNGEIEEEEERNSKENYTRSFYEDGKLKSESKWQLMGDRRIEKEWWYYGNNRLKELTEYKGDSIIRRECWTETGKPIKCD